MLQMVTWLRRDRETHPRVNGRAYEITRLPDRLGEHGFSEYLAGNRQGFVRMISTSRWRACS